MTTKRRRARVVLNGKERVHDMAHEIRFARRGRFTDSGYEAQLTRASALSLAINAIIV